MEFVPFLVLVLLLNKAIDWVKVLVPDHIEPKVMIPVAWVLGVGLALLFSASDALAGDIIIWGAHTLASADTALVVVYGLAVGSGAGVVQDLKLTKPS